MSEQAVALAKLMALERLKKCFEFRVVEHEIKATRAVDVRAGHIFDMEIVIESQCTDGSDFADLPTTRQSDCRFFGNL